jgi:3D (Asp-Asp-Asp) domain-containing protein
LTHAELRSLAFAILAALIAIFLSACETTTVANRALPPYETPLAKSDFQSVHTTAYTHTEADHTQYSNRNALGGKLQAASPPIHRAENTARAIPVDLEAQSDYQRVANSGARLQPFSMEETRTVTRTTTRVTKTTRGGKKITVTRTKPPKIGSAAADWSRWPAGTTFRLLSTGQISRVDDYGWALSGRNTIDLYMATSHEMNSWGARQEPIQILHWGDTQESLRFLEARQNYKHVRRMVLELQGNEQEAASLR